MTTKELTEAVSLLLEREKERIAAEERAEEARLNQQRQDRRDRIRKTHESIIVIKWCIVGITAIMTAAVIAVIAIAIGVKNEAEKIDTRVQEIKHQAEMIKDKLRHPFESAAGAMGRRLDTEVKERLSIGE